MKYETIKPYLEKKLISEQVHPDAPHLHIFNYTQHCQFEGIWDEVTTQCRGLILNMDTGEIVARPFPKFFNYGEYVSKGWIIPDGVPMITEKLDGSLGILYWLNNEPWIATRGSFMSEQAQWATKWFRENLGEYSFAKDKTFLFEIIYPENRIVVNYNYSGLVLLEMIDTKTGKSEQPVVVSMEQPKNLRLPKQIPSTDLATLSTMDEPNNEGFVLKYPNDVRIKIKFPEYVLLHKIITGVSEIGIWEMLRDEKSLSELMEKVPDEFFDWVSKVRFELEKQYAGILTQCRNDFLAINHAGRSRKDIARDFQNDCKYPSVLFAMLDDKDYKKIIWKMIRPRGQSQFKVDIDQ